MRALEDFEIEHWLSLHSTLLQWSLSALLLDTKKNWFAQRSILHLDRMKVQDLYACVCGSQEVFAEHRFRVDCWESSYVGMIWLASVRLSTCQVIEWSLPPKLWNAASPEDIKSVAQEIQPLIAGFQSSYTSWTCQSSNVSGFNNDGSGLSASHYGPPVKMTLNLWMLMLVAVVSCVRLLMSLLIPSSLS